MNKNIAYKTFLLMKRQNITYCIWKSKDRFREGLNGETDFDILVDRKDKKNVFLLLKKLHWIPVDAERWRTFPEVYDFIIYDSISESILHMHVHFQLIMGESGVKSLILPWDKLYFANILDKNGINFVRPEIELLALLIRISFKVRIKDYIYITIYMSPSKIYRNIINEYNELRRQCSKDKFEKILHSQISNQKIRSILIDCFEDLQSLTFYRRKIIRKFFRKNQRYGYLHIQLKKIDCIISRKLTGVGKTLLLNNKNFAICGPDGSGKTTLTTSLKKKLSTHLKVDIIYMGGSPRSRGFQRKLLRLTIFPLFVTIRNILESLNLTDKAGWVKNKYYNFEEYLITFEKIKRYQGSLKKFARGHLIIYERFPIIEGHGDLSHGHYMTLLNESIDNPNHTFVLMVTPESAQRRKPDHDQTALTNKALAFENFKKIKNNHERYTFINSNLEQNQIVRQVMTKIFEEISLDH